MAKKIYQQQGFMPPVMTNPTAIKTKKYALETSIYTKLGLQQVWKEQWKWIAVPIGLILLNLVINLTDVYHNIWIYILVVIGAALYALFWVIQFMGITQLEQYKPLFQRFAYEIDSRQILMKTSKEEGGIMKWDMIKSAQKTDVAYILIIARGQFVYLPFGIFNSDHDLKLMDRILTQKNLIVPVA